MPHAHTAIPLACLSKHTLLSHSYCVRNTDPSFLGFLSSRPARAGTPSRGRAGLKSTSTIAQATVGTVEFPEGS